MKKNSINLKNQLVNIGAKKQNYTNSKEKEEKFYQVFWEFKKEIFNLLNN